MNFLLNLFKKTTNYLEESYQNNDSFSPRLSIPLNIHPYAIKYRGKILTRNELEISNRQLDFLIRENYVRRLPSITKEGKTIKCMRCENINITFFAEIDCKKCLSKHLYCRVCIEMNRILACESLYYWHDQSIEFKHLKKSNYWQGKLTKNQEYGANQSINALENKTDLLIWAVTGSGKTELVFPVITEALKKGMRICIASPRTDVVKEFRLRIDSVFKKTSIAALYSGSDELQNNAQIIVTTNHQLLRFKRTFDLLIIDEVDAYPYASDSRLKEITKRSRKIQGTTIYLTATPNQALKIIPTVFIPKRYHGQPLIIPQIKYSYFLKKQLSEQKLPSDFINILKKREKPKRQLLIFVPTVQLSKDLKEEIINLLMEFKLINKKEEVATVHAADDNRNEKVIAFREHKLYCLITTTILERGVTFPSVDVIVVQADNEIFNSAALVQISGRAGRSPNDPKGDVYFMVNNNTRAIKECLKDIKHMNKLAKELIL